MMFLATDEISSAEDARLAMNRRASALGALVVPALLPRVVSGTRVRVQMQRMSKGVNQEIRSRPSASQNSSKSRS